MKFGVFDHMDDAGGPLGQLYADRLALIEAYDRSGIYGYHLAEHHSTPLGCAASPGLFLAAMTQRTTTLRFGPLVYLLPFYHPLRLIEEICMLDQMSGGRLELGIGRGVSPFETRAYGLDFAQTGEIYHEAFQLILQGLASDELTFEGKHYHPAAAAAAPASAAMVRNHDPRERGLAGSKRRKHRDHRTAPDGARHHRPLPRRTRAPGQDASSVHGGGAPRGGGRYRRGCACDRAARLSALARQFPVVVRAPRRRAADRGALPADLRPARGDRQ